MLRCFRRKWKFLTRSLLTTLLLCLPFTVAAKQYKGAEIYTLAAEGPYGKYEMRIRAAKGSGLISAFFLWKEGSELPAGPWEEVDIEIFGKDNAESWQTNIITGDVQNKIMSEQVHPAGFSLGDAYHVFTIEWTPDSLIWSLDGTPVHTANSANNNQVDDLINPSQLRFNVWASTSTDWVGPWDDDILPRYMYVDWVAYYPWNGTAFEADPEWRDDFDSFDASRWGKADWTFDGNRVDFLPENAYVYGGFLYLRVSNENAEDDSSPDYGSDSGSGGGGCIGLVMGAFLYLISKRRKSKIPLTKALRHKESNSRIISRGDAG